MEDDEIITFLSGFQIPRLKKVSILARFYKIANGLTDLFFGVDKDIENLPEKRVRRKPSDKTGIGTILNVPFKPFMRVPERKTR